MFSYKKKTATAFLIIYIINVIVIFAFSLMSSSLSFKMSSLFYDTIEKIKYGSADNRQIKEVQIESLDLIVTDTTFASGTKTQYFINNITPANHTEFYFLMISDEEKAECDGKYIYFKEEGIFDVWAESASGVKSDVITITVLEEYDENFVVDKTKFAINMPDELAINDACGIYYTYDGNSPKFKTTFEIVGECVENVSNRFIAAKDEGEFTFNVKYNDEVVCSKTIVVTSEMLPFPEFKSISFDNRPIGGDTELLYKKVYETSVEFESEECCQLYFLKTGYATLLYNFSADKTKVKALTDKLEGDEVSVYSPVRPDVPLYTFHIYVKPPEPTVVGMNIAEQCKTKTKYNIMPKLANADSEYGLTYTIEGGKEGSYEYVDLDTVRFLQEGLYTIVYTSSFYPDFEYRYQVIVKDTDREGAARKTYGHFGLFVVLGLFAVLTFGYFAKKPVYKSIFIAIGGIVPAIISELLQLPFFTDGRGATVKDVFIDLGGFAIGVALTMAVIVIVYFVRKRKGTLPLADEVTAVETEPIEEERTEENSLPASDETEE